MWVSEATYDSMVKSSAMRNGLDPLLIKALIGQESGFRPNAVRAEVAIGDASYGLTQILYSTAQSRGFLGRPADLLDPATNIEYGARQIKWCLDHSPTLDAAISRYNGGFNAACGFGVLASKPGRCCVARDAHGSCVRWSSFQAGEFGNQDYVDKVLANYAYFQSLVPMGAVPVAPPIPSAPATAALPVGLKVGMGAALLGLGVLAWLLFGRRG